MEKRGKTDEHAWNDGEHVIYISSVKYVSIVFFAGCCEAKFAENKHLKVSCQVLNTYVKVFFANVPFKRFWDIQQWSGYINLDIKTGLVSVENGNMEKSDHKILPCWERIFTALFSKSCCLVFFSSFSPGTFQDKQLWTPEIRIDNEFIDTSRACSLKWKYG